MPTTNQEILPFVTRRGTQTPAPLHWLRMGWLWSALMAVALLITGAPGCQGEPVCRQDSDCQSLQGKPHCVLAQCKGCATDDHCQAGQTCDQQQGTCLVVGEQPPTDDRAEPPANEPPSRPDQADASPERTPERTPERLVPEQTPETQPTEPQPDQSGCQPGATRPCYEGPGQPQGPCKAGTQFCLQNGTWSTCRDQILPVKELCDGVDNDCDGQIDEDFPEKGKACEAGQGTCKQSGTFACSNDKTSTLCDATPKPPQPDFCDGKDNDCNGKIDDLFPDLGKPCTSGAGECQRTGKNVCSTDGKSVLCDAKAAAPTKEVCDGKDNDCDGQADNGIQCACQNGTERVCGSNVGECKQGTQTCNNGVWGSCQGGISAKAETCDGKDNDCDGQIDENLTRTCFTGTTGCTATQSGYNCEGTCSAGVQRCSAGKWGTCSGQVLPTKELCDGKDNDCDGRNDEDFSLARSCTSGQGECRQTGRTICSSDGTKVICDATPGQPQTELCDGKDNDCDGDIDEDAKQSCTLQGLRGECAKGETACVSAKITCQQVTQASAETCDGKDNDCDGRIDETFPDRGRSCTTTLPSPCSRGTFACVSGVKTCVVTSAPIEICRNNQDDDCDGKIDEICGPAHPIVVSEMSNNRWRQLYARTLQASRVGDGRYELSASSFKCADIPIFLTLANTKPAISYRCKSGSSGEYEVFTHRSLIISGGGYDDEGFYAIAPLKQAGEIFGVMNDSSCNSNANNECKLTGLYGTAKITELQGNVYEIDAAPCATSSPLLIQPLNIGSSLRDRRYAQVAYSNQKCLVAIADNNGRSANSPFAFWFPNSKTHAYAQVDSSGTITSSNNLGDARAQWAVQTGSQNRYRVSFPSWSNGKTAAIAQSNSPNPRQMVAIPDTSGVTVYGRTNFSTATTSFTILFVP